MDAFQLVPCHLAVGLDSLPRIRALGYVIRIQRPPLNASLFLERVTYCSIRRAMGEAHFGQVGSEERQLEKPLKFWLESMSWGECAYMER